MIYESIKTGVYILGVSGKLYTEDGWDSQETANGVAVLTEQCEFIISLQNPSYQYDPAWCMKDDLILGMTTTTEEDVAKLDYLGKSNTDAYIKLYGTDTISPASLCVSYTFPNGKTGYLGAAGEWQIVCDNIQSVNNCLTICGGDEILLVGYQTSTLYDISKCLVYFIYFRFILRYKEKRYKDTSFFVRLINILNKILLTPINKNLLTIY